MKIRRSWISNIRNFSEWGFQSFLRMAVHWNCRLGPWWFKSGLCFDSGSGLAFRNMHKCAHHKFTLFWFETFKRILTGQYFMPFPTQLNWFKVKPSILVFGILNTESRKTSSPPLPSSAPWDGRRFAWLCSETKIREGAEHQRKVSHHHPDLVQSQVSTVYIVIWVENLLSDQILVYNPPPVLVGGQYWE